MGCVLEQGERSGWLLDYCARKLSREQTEAVEGHLASCESCREAVRTQRAVWDFLDSWEGVTVSPDFRRRLYARVEADRRRGFLTCWIDSLAARWSPISWQTILPLAAASAVLIAVLCIQNIRQTSAAETPEGLERMDLDQWERTLQDFEMVQQLGPKVAVHADHRI